MKFDYKLNNFNNVIMHQKVIKCRPPGVQKQTGSPYTCVWVCDGWAFVSTRFALDHVLNTRRRRALFLSRPLFSAPPRELLKKEVIASPANTKGVGRRIFLSLAQCVRVYGHLEKNYLAAFIAAFVSGNYKEDEEVVVRARALGTIFFIICNVRSCMTIITWDRQERIFLGAI